MLRLDSTKWHCGIIGIQFLFSFSSCQFFFYFFFFKQEIVCNHKIRPRDHWQLLPILWWMLLSRADINQTEQQSNYIWSHPVSIALCWYTYFPLLEWLCINCIKIITRLQSFCRIVFLGDCYIQMSTFSFTKCHKGHIMTFL